ncbi:hypothetical protein JL722_5586 [Aureococcus anophagefferens]|nr:hypothetical protein JL722_5586 [Aureococcus anophagefferens]
MRGALGLGPAGWRLRDASAGGVSLAPRDDAEDAAEDVFVEVASSKTTRCRRGRGVARQAHALRKALARLHGACACDGELAARLGEVLPCLAAARLRWPRPPPAHGRRPWSLGGNEAWCAFDAPAHRLRREPKLRRSSSDARANVFAMAKDDGRCVGDGRGDASRVAPPGDASPERCCDLDAVDVRRDARRGDARAEAAVDELRFRSAWTTWLCGSSRPERRAALGAYNGSDRGDTLGEYRLKLWLSRLLSDAARRAGDRDPSSAQSGDGGGGAARRLLMLQMLGPNLADAAAAAACRRLADAGAVVDGEGAFPLFDAAKNGRALAAALLEAGAPPRAPPGECLVGAARSARAFELAEELQAAGAKRSLPWPDPARGPGAVWPGCDPDDLAPAEDVDAEEDEDEEEDGGPPDTTLPWEWVPDSAAAVRALAKAGCDVRAGGDALLHHCVRYRLLDAAEALLEAGCDANARDGANLTPLHYACSARRRRRRAAQRGDDDGASDDEAALERARGRAAWPRPRGRRLTVPEGSLRDHRRRRRARRAPAARAAGRLDRGAAAARGRGGAARGGDAAATKSAAPDALDLFEASPAKGAKTPVPKLRFSDEPATPAPKRDDAAPPPPVVVGRREYGAALVHAVVARAAGCAAVLLSLLDVVGPKRAAREARGALSAAEDALGLRDADGRNRRRRAPRRGVARRGALGGRRPAGPRGPRRGGAPRRRGREPVLEPAGGRRLRPDGPALRRPLARRARRTALHAACASGCADGAAALARAFLKHDPAYAARLPSLPDALGQSPLGACADRAGGDDAGRARCVAALLALGADPTPATCACGATRGPWRASWPPASARAAGVERRRSTSASAAARRGPRASCSRAAPTRRCPSSSARRRGDDVSARDWALGSGDTAATWRRAVAAYVLDAPRDVSSAEVACDDARSPLNSILRLGEAPVAAERSGRVAAIDCAELRARVLSFDPSDAHRAAPPLPRPVAEAIARAFATCAGAATASRSPSRQVSRVQARALVDAPHGPRLALGRADETSGVSAALARRAVRREARGRQKLDSAGFERAVRFLLGAFAPLAETQDGCPVAVALEQRDRTGAWVPSDALGGDARSVVDGGVAFGRDGAALTVPEKFRGTRRARVAGDGRRGRAHPGLAARATDTRGRPARCGDEHVVICCRVDGAKGEDWTPPAKLDYRGRADAKLSFARAGAYVLRAKVLGPRGLALLKQGGRWAREAVAVSDPVAISVAAGPPETAKVRLRDDQRTMLAGAPLPTPAVDVLDAFGNVCEDFIGKATLSARRVAAAKPPNLVTARAPPPRKAGPQELTLSLRKGRVAVEDAKACARKLAEDASFLSGAAGDYRWFAEVAPATPGQAALRASSDAFKVKCSYAAEYAVFTEGPVVAGRGGRLGVAPVDRAGNVVEAHAPARVHVEVWATSVALPPDAHPRAVEMGETRANGVLELARVTAARAKVDKLGERLLADLKRERDKGALSSPRKEALLVWETVFDAARGATFADAPASVFERAGSYVAKVHANISKASGASPRLSAKAGPHRATRELTIAVTAGPPAALDVALPKGLFECDERVRARVRVVDKLGNLCSGTHYTAFVTLELYEVREDPAKRETVTEDDADEAEHDTTQVDAPATDAPLPEAASGAAVSKEEAKKSAALAEVAAAAVNAAKKREKPPAKFLLGTKRQFPAVAAAKGPLGKEAAKHKGLDTVDGVADFAGVDARCAGAGAYCVVARGKVWLAGGKASVDVCGASPLFDVVNGPPAKISFAPDASKAVFPPPDDRLLVAEELWTSVLPTFKVTDAAGHVVRASDAAPFTIYLTIMRCASENVDGDATERVRHAAAIAKLQEEQRLTRTWCPMLLGITAKTFKASPEGLAAFDASEELAAPLPGRYRLKASLMTRSGDMGEWTHVARCFSRPFDVVPPLDWLDDDQRPADPAAPRTMPKENPWLANACWFHATEEEVAHITETLAKIEKTEQEIAELTERKRAAEEKTARNLDRWAAEKAAATAAGRALVDQWLERTGGKKKEYAPKPSEDRPGFKSYDPPHAGLRVDQEKQRCLALARYKFILKKDLEEVKADLKKQKALAQERKKKLPFSKPPAKTKDDDEADDFDPEEPVKHMDDLACGLIPRDVIEKLVDDPNLPGRPAAAYGACDKREALDAVTAALRRGRAAPDAAADLEDEARCAARDGAYAAAVRGAGESRKAVVEAHDFLRASFIRQCRQCRDAKDDKKLKHSLQVNLGGYDHVKRLAAEALVSAAERVDAILGKHRARACVEINHWFGGPPPNFRTLYLG